MNNELPIPEKKYTLSEEHAAKTVTKSMKM